MHSSEGFLCAFLAPLSSRGSTGAQIWWTLNRTKFLPASPSAAASSSSGSMRRNLSAQKSRRARTLFWHSSASGAACCQHDLLLHVIGRRHSFANLLLSRFIYGRNLYLLYWHPERREAKKIGPSWEFVAGFTFSGGILQWFRLELTKVVVPTVLNPELLGQRDETWIRSTSIARDDLCNPSCRSSTGARSTGYRELREAKTGRACGMTKS